MPHAVVERAAQRRKDLESAGGGLKEMSRIALFKSVLRLATDGTEDLADLVSLRQQVRLALGH